MKQRLFSILTALLFSVLVTCACSGLYLQVEPVLLRLELKTDKVLQLRCCYATEPTEGFSESKTVRKEVPLSRDYAEVEIELPVAKVCRVKLNPGENPGAVSLRNIRLIADAEKKCSVDDFTVTGVNACQRDNGILTLEASRTEPWLTYEPALEVARTATKMDWYIFFIVVILSCMLGYGVGSAAGNKWCRNSRKQASERGSLVYTVIFCVLLVLPWVKLDKSEVSVAENRRLAPFPVLLPACGGVNLEFGKEFDAWLQDHAAFRRVLTSAYFDVKTRLAAVRETARVIMYDDNWMFSKQYHEAASVQFTPEQLRKMTANLKKLNEWCAQKNIKLYLLVCPTKEILYADFNKSAAKGDMRCVERLQEHLQKELPELKFIYPLEAMKAARQASPSVLLHYKSDSHQTEDGAYIMYAETMKVIQQDFPDVPLADKEGAHVRIVRNNLVLRRDKPLQNLYYEGGLYENLDLTGTSVLDAEYTHYENAAPEAGCVAGEEPMEFRFRYPQGRYKAMLLGDSYSSYQQLWFRYSFADMHRVRANNGVNGGEMKMQRWEKTLSDNPPDIMILCICSGRLDLHLPALYD